MKKLISIVLCLAVLFSSLSGLTVFAQTQDVSNETSYINETFLDRVRSDFDLVWSDEFNGDTLDTTKWQFDGQMTRRNSELQIYADSMENGNLQFDGESAIIVPKIETRVAQDGRKYKYTSAEISTQGKQSWKYGYFEIRAKQACGKNIVPAIWMMGYDYPSGTCDWPYSGEIDIMERLNSDKQTESTLHHGVAYGEKYHKATGAGTQSYDHKINEQFHNYWLFWTDKYLIIGVDDSMHSIIDITKPELAQSFRTFEHWLIINVAMGMFSNPVDDSQEDEWKMWIDYVRVYQLNDDNLYENYKAFSTLDLKHNGSEYAYGKTVSTLKGDPTLDFTIQDELTPGKYDVYAEINNKDIVTYINGVKANEIEAIDHGKAVGNQAFVGSVDLQDQSNFDVSFKAEDGSTVTIEKLIFVKTDENKTTPVVVNKENGVTVSDYFEVSTEEELISAIRCLKEKGTIKLLNDITLTKRVYTFNEPTIDLNGKTLTVNGGYFAISDENKPNIIKNGNVIISGKLNYFINTRENNYNAKVKCEDLNVTINSTASWGYVFTHNYANIGIEANNCTFTFGEKVSSESTYMISKTTGIYNNCTFNLNGRKAFLMSNGSNTSTRKLHLNNCIVNDALYLFHSDNALTNYVDVKLANTTLNNLSSLTNFAENAQFVSVANNNVLKQNGEAVSVSADMSGNFTMECNHNYLDADCLLPKYCEYCNKFEGVALGHNIVTETTQADCLNKGSIKAYCDKCSTVFSEKVLPVTEHNYQLVETFEPSCKMSGYHLWACESCGMQQQRAYNGDGKNTKLPHNPDTSRTTVIAPTCTMGGYTQNYCLDCGSAYKTNLKWSIDHDCTETIDYDAGAIIYNCKNCDYTNTAPLDTCPHTPVENSGVVHEPTCKAQGYTEYTCNLCGKTYKDDYVDKLPSCVADTSKDKVVGATCVLDGYTEHTCKFCGVKFKTDIVPATGIHTPDISKDKVVAPTCKAQGYTEHYCTVCKKTYKDNFVAIDKDAHEIKTINAIEPTCSEFGYTQGSSCELCGTIIVESKEIPKLPHTIVTDLGKFPSCSETGLTMGSHCSVCNEVIVAQEVIPKLPHQEQTQFGYSATCTKTGLTDKIWCGICDEVLQEAEVIPVLPHNFILKGKKDASYTAKGYTGDTVCSVCGEVESYGKEIPRKTLKKPTIKLSKKGNKLTVTIKKVTGAKKYEILIKIGKKWKKFTSKKLKFTKKLTKGKKYQVKVRAIAGTNKGKYSSIKKIKL